MPRISMQWQSGRGSVPGIKCLLMLMVCLLPGSALGLSGAHEQALSAEIEYLEDPGAMLTLEEVKARPDWQANEARTFNKGYNDSAWWLRFSLSNNQTEAVKRLLSLSYPVLDDVVFYTLSSHREPQRFETGHDRPFMQRPMDHRYFVLPMEWEPGERIEVYLRVKSTSAVQVPLTVWEPDTFYSTDTTHNMLHGIYFGALLVIAVYNLLLFFALGERNYLYYVAFVSSMALFMAALTGYGYRHLWPASTSWNDQAILFFLASVIFFAVLFSRRFLRIREISIWLDRGAIALLAISLAAGVLAFVLPYGPVIAVLIPLVVVGCLYGLGAGCYAWYRGQSTARYYVIAWSFLLLGGIILALSKAGYLPSNTFTDYSAQIGSLIEVVLLSFALAQRINVERQLRFKAQSQALETTRRLNQELEDRVEKRTHELKRMNDKLNELSVTDELTGLKNRRHMDKVLEQELARAKRTGSPLAVALLDIDHFKPVNDTYGHPVGDECLKLVGEIIHSALRWPSDTATRYGGEEFAIIFPETNAEGARLVVERIRTRIEQNRMELDDVTLSLTISGGIYAPEIHPELTPGEILSGADEALYESKRNGRNQTRIHAPDGPTEST